jgi:type II secretory pathway pseudopilin PulG
MSRALRPTALGQYLRARSADLRGHSVRRRAAADRQARTEVAERGFVLLEEIVAITLLMIVMAALATFFITVTQSTTYERARQSAVQLANTEMDAVNAVSATDLCSGRTPSTDSTQFAGAPPTVAAALQTTQQACGTNTTASTPTLPLTTTAVANNITYTLTNYLGNCWIPTVTALGTACTNTAAAIAAGTPYLRAVVSATWQGNHCPQVSGTGLCTYVTSALISAQGDPTFNLCTLGAACGPAPPQLVNPGNQVSLVNSAVSLQLSLVAYTGVAPITWFAAGLPSWLTLNTATGLITGTAPSAAAAPVTVTVTATDAFARTTQSVFTWTVVVPPTITGLTTPYTATAGVPIGTQTLPYTCPTSSCTYTLAGAPSGVGLATTSGGPGAASQMVSNSSGNLYLVGIPATSVLPTSTAYAADVVNQGASNYWRLDETSGSTGADSISGSTNSPLIEQPGVGHGAAGALLTNADAASTFDGAADGSAATPTAITGPQTFSEEIWFRTTTTSGGRLMGFGTATTGVSSFFDRNIYMDNAGHIYFGVCGDSCPATVSTSASYNDGQWHQAVGTLTSSGITLYVDGQKVGTNTGVHSAQAYSGYWRLGGDTLAGWPNQPSSNYFAGTLDEASVYPTALTPAQVQQQYSDSGRVPFTVTVTPQDQVTGATGVVDQAAWTVVPTALPTITGLNTPFVTTAGASITSQPLPYTCATTSVSCTYSLAGAPSGIGLALTPTGIGQPTQTVLNSSGTLYAVGTVSSSVAPSATAYTNDVKNQGATNYWRLDEATGSTAVDSIGGNNLLEQAGVGHGVADAILSNADTADTFDGSTAGYAAEQTLVPAPRDFSESIWFRTQTTLGGKLIGFASNNTTPSVANDRHIYMDNSGHLRFGTWSNGPQVIATSGTYNDGQWHQAVGTYSVAGGGMTFYVDGVLIGTNPANVPYPQAGYWRIGGDSLDGSTWPGPYSSTYFQGTLDDASIYAKALTAAQVQQQYADSGRVPFALTATPKDQTTGATGLVDPAAWTVDSPPTVIGLATPFTVTAGTTISAQSLPYNCPLSSCSYSVSGAPAGIGLSLTPGGTASNSVSVTALTGAVYLVGTVGTGVTPGTFTVTVTPKDTASGVTGTPATATWTVSSRLAVTSLTNPFSTTVGATLSQTVSYTCPSTACSFTVTGLPTGVGLDNDNVGPVGNVVTVTGPGTGNIYLRGTVGAGTAGRYSVVLTPRDTVNNVTGTAVQAAWTVYAAPTVTGLVTPFTTTAGATLASQPLPYTCPSSSCTYTLAGAPTGVGLDTDNVGAVANSVTVTGSTSGNIYLRGTVAASTAPSATAYTGDVRSQGASNYWRLNDTGSTGADALGSFPLTEQAGVGHGVGGAIASNTDTASTFDGSSVDGSASTTTAFNGPQTFTEEIWFRTTTTAGGKLIGFGNVTSGLSSQYDRHIYMDNAGHLLFGVYNGATDTLATTATYNDGQWHQAVGTLSGAGMTFFVDGVAVGSNPSWTVAESHTGYWRIGGDNLSGWPNQPTSNYFAGTLGEAAIYPTALTAAQVGQQFSDSGRVPFSLTVTPADTASGVAGPTNQAAWTVYSPPAVTGLTTPFGITAGATVANQTLPFSCPGGTCSFALTGAPAGVGLSSAATGPVATSISVTATSGVLYLRGPVDPSTGPGTTTVAVTPTDTASGVVGSPSQANWTVAAGPSVNGVPSGFSLTIGEVVPNVGIAYTCPSGNCTLALNAAAPTGLVLSTGTNGGSTTSVTVSATSGTVYVSGTIGTAATLGPYTVSVIPTDNVSGAVGVASTGMGTIYAAPTVSGQTTPLKTSVGATIANDSLAYTCPSGSCTFTVANAPNGIGLYGDTTTATTASAPTSISVTASSGTIWLRGTIQASTALGTSTVTITPTATDPASGINTNGPASTGAWTLVAAMALGSPPTVTVARGAVASKTFTYTCRTTSCTVSVSGMPIGTGLSTASTGGTVVSSLLVNAGTGTLYLRGTVTSSDPPGAYPIVLTLTDPAGSTITSSVTWTVT